MRLLSNFNQPRVENRLCLRNVQSKHRVDGRLPNEVPKFWNWRIFKPRIHRPGGWVAANKVFGSHYTMALHKLGNRLPVLSSFDTTLRSWGNGSNGDKGTELLGRERTFDSVREMNIKGSGREWQCMTPVDCTGNREAVSCYWNRIGSHELLPHVARGEPYGQKQKEKNEEIDRNGSSYNAPGGFWGFGAERCKKAKPNSNGKGAP